VIWVKTGGSINATIKNGNVKGNNKENTGIFTGNTTDFAQIERITISDCLWGLRVGSLGNTITNCTIKNCIDGILVGNRNTTISSCNIFDLESTSENSGIKLELDQNFIFNNLVNKITTTSQSNFSYGILDLTGNNVITGNTVSLVTAPINSGVGIRAPNGTKVFNNSSFGNDLQYSNIPGGGVNGNYE